MFLNIHDILDSSQILDTWDNILLKLYTMDVSKVDYLDTVFEMSDCFIPKLCIASSDNASVDVRKFHLCWLW